MERFSLETPAPNGLRRGFTTGSCATAALTAATLFYLRGEKPESVSILLPDGIYELEIPIDVVRGEPGGKCRAEVIKDAGDDPDQTHQARIWVEVESTPEPGIHFKAGKGVGTVTQAGLHLGVGEPAINPTPRVMMRRAIESLLDESDEMPPQGWIVTVGCERGEEIAKRTFNPRLGIVGGISILGTSGIVEPKSLAAFQASIALYVRVALAEGSRMLVLSPGNLGQRFARESLLLPLRQVVQMSNFIGFTLDHVEAELERQQRSLEMLWVVGHPGKLGKILAGSWDTHSKESPSAVPAIAKLYALWNRPASMPDIKMIESSSTVEGVIQLLRDYTEGRLFWRFVEQAIEKILKERLKCVEDIRVRLFQMDGKSLAGDGDA